MSSHYWIIKLALIFLFSSSAAIIIYMTLLCVMWSLIQINCIVYPPSHSVARIEVGSFRYLPGSGMTKAVEGYLRWIQEM